MPTDASRRIYLAKLSGFRLIGVVNYKKKDTKMDTPHCPGQDMRFWKPEDIYNVDCPFCQTAIEFWKDEPMRICPECKNPVPNPKIDSGCQDWCNSKGDCQGPTPNKQE
jgi:hypothetical protein